MADWSSLPDITLALIFSYLSTTDRLKVASVCTTWQYALLRPEAWTSFCYSENYLSDSGQTEEVGASGDRNPITSEFKDPETEFLTLIENVGKYFKHVSILYKSQKSNQIVNSLAENCKSITYLKIQRLKNSVQVVRNHDSSCNSGIRTLLHQNIKLRSIYLQDIDNLSVSQSQGLLPFGAAHSSSLTQLTLIQAYQGCNLGNLMYLIKLRELFIEPHLLSYSLLHHLAGNSLKDLHIVAVTKHMALYNENLQNWQWKEIRKRNQHFRVHCHFAISHRWVEKEIILKEEMPVETLRYVKYKLLNYESLTRLVCNFADTLVEFLDYSYSAASYLDTAPNSTICSCLLTLVNTCHNLRTVTAKEAIFSCAVIAIFLKNKNIDLLFLEKQLVFEPLVPDLNLLGYSSQELDLIKTGCYDKETFDTTVFQITGRKLHYYSHTDLTKIMFARHLKFV